MKSKRLGFLRFFISFGAIGIILFTFRKQLSEIAAILGGMSIHYFILAIFSFSLCLVFLAIRLQSFFLATRIKLNFLECYYLSWIAVFFNNVLPSSIGGDAMKAYYAYRKTNGRKDSFSAVVVDRLFGLITLVAIGAVSILFLKQGERSPRVLASVFILAVAASLFSLFLFNKKVACFLTSLKVPFLPANFLGHLNEIYLAMHNYRHCKPVLVKSILLSVLAQFVFVSINFLLAKSLAIDIPFLFLFFFVPIIAVLALAPSINGVGVREASYLFFLGEITTMEKALALSLLTTFYMILIGMIGGLVYAFFGGSDCTPPGKST